MQNIIAIFADCAVSAFFIVSAYLFFRNFEMNMYLGKLKNKFNTLFIPYIMWSTVGLMYKMIISEKFRLEIFGGWNNLIHTI